MSSRNSRRKKRVRTGRSRQAAASEVEAAKLSDCVDCKQPFFFHQQYIVRNATWAAAGMQGWGGGYLHRECLEKRLGRKLKPEEILVRMVRQGKGYAFVVRPEYQDSPEFRED